VLFQAERFLHAGWLIRITRGVYQTDLLQTPVLLFSFVLVATKVNIRLPDDVQNQRLSDKLRRIDFLGSLTLVGAVGCLLLGFSLKTTEEMQWSDPLVAGFLVASVVFGLLFVLVEKHWAPYPVMPLRLITQRTPLAVSISNLLTSMSAFSMVSFTSSKLASSFSCRRQSFITLHWWVALFNILDQGSHARPVFLCRKADLFRCSWLVFEFTYALNHANTYNPGLHLLPHSVRIFYRLPISSC
jgi:hypothetical protein